MKKIKLNRRQLLKSSLSTSLAALAWQLMEGQSFGQNNNLAKRVVLLYSPCGVYNPTFWPGCSSNGNGNDQGYLYAHIPDGFWQGNPDKRRALSGLTLPPGMSSLEPYKNDITLVHGLSWDSPDFGRDHRRANIQMFTGRSADTSNDQVRATGPSLDVYVASRRNQQALILDAVQSGTANLAANRYNRFITNNTLAPSTANPYEAYSRVFNNFDPSGLTTPVIPDTSALDFAALEMNAIKSRFSNSVVDRIDVGLQSISDLSARLRANPVPVVGPTGQYCAANTNAQPIAGFQPNNAFLDQAIELHMDLIVASMACGLRSAASLSMTGGASTMTFPNLRFENRQVRGTHHNISHQGVDVGGLSLRDAFGFHTVITNYFMSKIGYLINKLKAVPEGDGTMLDNTIILYHNELGQSNHNGANYQNRTYSGSMFSIPTIVAGGTNMGIKLGDIFTGPHNQHSGLLNTITSRLGEGKLVAERGEYNKILG